MIRVGFRSCVVNTPQPHWFFNSSNAFSTSARSRNSRATVSRSPSSESPALRTRLVLGARFRHLFGRQLRVLVVPLRLLVLRHQAPQHHRQPHPRPAVPLQRRLARCCVADSYTSRNHLHLRPTRRNNPECKSRSRREDAARGRAALSQTSREYERGPATGKAGPLAENPGLCLSVQVSNGDRGPSHRNDVVEFSERSFSNRFG